MKYVSLDQIELYFSHATEKAICFQDLPKRYSDNIQNIWIPKKLIKVAFNSDEDFIFFIPSWYYMNEIQKKLYYRNGIPTHHEESKIISNFKGFINSLECEMD